MSEIDKIDVRCKAWVAREFAAGRSQKSIAWEIGTSQSAVCLWIKSFCDEWSGVDVSGIRAYNDDRRPWALKALREWFLATGDETVVPGAIRSFDRNEVAVFWYARNEHAWLLRAEGKTFAEIGKRLGVSRSRVRQMVNKFGRRAARALRQARITVR